MRNSVAGARYVRHERMALFESDPSPTLRSAGPPRLVAHGQVVMARPLPNWIRRILKGKSELPKRVEPPPIPLSSIPRETKRNIPDINLVVAGERLSRDRPPVMVDQIDQFDQLLHDFGRAQG